MNTVTTLHTVETAHRNVNRDSSLTSTHSDELYGAIEDATQHVAPHPRLRPVGESGDLEQQWRPPLSRMRAAARRSWPPGRGGALRCRRARGAHTWRRARGS